MVNRFNCNHIDGVERDDENGDFVRAEDYDALAARLAAQETATRQADERGDEAMRRAHAAEARLAEAERLLRDVIGSEAFVACECGDADCRTTVLRAFLRPAVSAPAVPAYHLDEQESDSVTRKSFSELAGQVSLRATSAECQHEWVDARNNVISSGEWCRKCSLVRAGNDATVGSAPAVESHEWFQHPRLPWRSCRKCGIVERRDGKNNACVGKVVIVLRPADSASAQEDIGQ